MSALALLRYWHLAYFTKPAHERVLYRAIRRQGVASIVELGVEQGLRTRRLIQAAVQYQSATPVRYTGIDLFEARPAERRGLTLKEAYRQLRSLGVSVQLVPGEPHIALQRVANTLVRTDLVVLSAEQAIAANAPLWFYLPRMLHEKSLVFIGSAGPSGPQYQLLDRAEVQRRAQACADQRRRAA